MCSTFTEQDLAERASAKLHDADFCAKTLGISISDVSPGAATATMKVAEEYANGHGYCQGGIITTLADTAFAHACNSHNLLTVAQGLSIEFVRSVKVGEVLTADATELSRSRSTGVYQVMVSNSSNQTVAIMTGKSFIRNGLSTQQLRIKD